MIRTGRRVRVADSGEPSAEERGWITWPMTDEERREFGEGIERTWAQYRAMTPQAVERLLAEVSTGDWPDLPPAVEDE